MTLFTLVTHAAMPEGVEDDHLLAQALRARGAQVRFAAWTDAAIDWSDSPVTIIRSTWDYHLHPTQWFAWLDDVSGRSMLVNPPELVRWNSDKSYLLDLAARDIAVIPTTLLTSDIDIPSHCMKQGWDDIVIKPTIGASAYGAQRFQGSAINSDAVAHAAKLATVGEALLQPYQRAVEVERERSLVYIDGQFCHAFSKPAFHAGLGTTSLMHHEATRLEKILGHKVLASFVTRPAFARIDLLPSLHGPVVMEVELVEPQLALGQDARTCERLANALLRMASV